MKRILVIGAKGMLGKDLVEILRSSSRVDQHLDWEVFGWDIEEIDIQEEKKTVNKIESLRPNIVINIAAYTNVDGCESHEEKVFAVNAEGMRHVAIGALRCRAKVVYLSTDYIFDGKKREPYLEDDPPHPLSVYGRSKLKGEQYVQEMVEDALIVRTSVLRQARGKKVLSIVNDQVGSPTYTIDLSRAISVLIQCDARGVFHVANSDLCTWFAFGQEILKLSGMEGVRIVPTSSEELGRPATRPLYSVLNTEKLKRETGMTLRPWSEALKDYLRDWESERANPLLQK
jgi:dTDP-4-dehydrorhamnose reductase